MNTNDMKYENNGQLKIKVYRTFGRICSALSAFDFLMRFLARVSN